MVDLLDLIRCFEPGRHDPVVAPGSVVGGFQAPPASPPDVSLADRLAHRRSEPARTPATRADGPVELDIADRLQVADVVDDALDLLGRDFGWDIT